MTDLRILTENVLKSAKEMLQQDGKIRPCVYLFREEKSEIIFLNLASAVMKEKEKKHLLYRIKSDPTITAVIICVETWFIVTEKATITDVQSIMKEGVNQQKKKSEALLIWASTPEKNITLLQEFKIEDTPKFLELKDITDYNTIVFGLEGLWIRNWSDFKKQFKFPYTNLPI